ncbi:hypothetical protein [Bosea sp. (in: a-proteobacteria)]|jgi:hypothetical protein|uniref:hypothetical protein n=1 Tax=Bosea sp. (in: a-proteobacteria) TaxID=1871050 RepID=UPI00086D5924|nr:hypothetical protein [Bosea sp. (in: a-proteobacteria)]MBN9438137.1 hypothetical protein [Bosea sp. (in: a-proteobacteria)]MBN9470539.1 hypothetical protein [Bosea sp. (in: a-proteobacteria)]ODT43745.1 MAG: hypothetical protein ABS59_22595 [Methylobacterium sp. SCN 67-24]
MARLAVFAGVVLALILGVGGPARAQEGCKPATGSCSAMFRSCEQNCNKVGNNPSACVARVCTPPLAGCKSNGVWRSVQSGSACWVTKNRS